MNDTKPLSKMYIIYLFFIITILGVNTSYSQNNQKPLSKNITQFREYVNDETGTLTPSQVNSLNTKLRDEDKETTNRIVVCMISSLDGESLEDVSIRLSEKNKIGRKDRNNGVIILIAKNERKMRIEVGYGLEGILTDVKSSSIIKNEITPSFKSGNYYEGINKGVDAIIATISQHQQSNEPKNEVNILQLWAGVCGIFIVIMAIVTIIGFKQMKKFRKRFYEK